MVRNGGFPPLKAKLVAALAGLALAAICPAGVSAAPVGQAAVTCTNPVSGAHWQIKIDYDHRTVDAYPARIGDTEISWHDVSDGGHYTLDRASGKLTVVVASSTGGYFLYDTCELKN